MAGRHEELKIVIQKDGQVWVEGPGLTPRRLEHYRQLMEEILGNAQLVAGPGEVPPQPHAQYEIEEEPLSAEEESNRHLKIGE